MAKKMKTGRKKVEPMEKVILVGFYIKRRRVEQVGGIQKAREIAADSVLQQALHNEHVGV